MHDGGEQVNSRAFVGPLFWVIAESDVYHSIAAIFLVYVVGASAVY